MRLLNNFLILETNFETSQSLASSLDLLFPTSTSISVTLSSIDILSTKVTTTPTVILGKYY